MKLALLYSSFKSGIFLCYWAHW